MHFSATNLKVVYFFPLPDDVLKIIPNFSCNNFVLFKKNARIAR